MVVGSYIAAHTILALCAASLLCNFVLQLLIERRSEYDRGQLYAKLRVDDWRTEQKRQKTGGDSGGSGSDTNRSVSGGGSQTPRPKVVVVGFTHWSVHRVGFLASLLLSIRCIDPFSVLGVLPVRFNSFLNWNINAFVYTFALIAFLYPIHLVRIVALQRRSRALVWIGVSLSIISFLLANIMPALYIAYGEKGSIRAVPNFWYIGSIFFVTIVYNIYMHRLARSINELIDWRDNMRAANSVVSPRAEAKPAAVALAVVVSDLDSPRSQDGPSSNSELQQQPQTQRPPSDTLLPVPLPTPSHSTSVLPSPKADDSECSREVSGNLESSTVNPPTPSLPADANQQRLAEPRQSASVSQKMGIQSVKKYRELMTKLRVTQVFGNIALLVIVIGVLIVGIDAIKHKDEDANKPQGDDFGSASFSALFSFFHVFVLSVAAWYSYLPISVLFQPRADVQP